MLGLIMPLKYVELDPLALCTLSRTNHTHGFFFKTVIHIIWM